MARYMARRALHALVLVVLTLSITFFLVHLAPGDPASKYFGPRIDPALADQVRQQLGLDDHVVVQYIRWMGSFVRGNFGVSFVSSRPVSEILGETVPRTLLLTVPAFLLQLIIGMLVGVVAARRRGRVDNVLSVTTLLVYAVPTFYLAYLLIALFSLKFGLLPSAGLVSVGSELSGWSLVMDRARHLLLPVLTLGIASAASLARYTRSGMIEALGQDHIRTARSKGLSDIRITWLHALRPSLPPLLTIVGLSVPFLLGGAVVVEKIFAWPGMGTLMVDSIYARDFPVVLAVSAIAAVTVIVANLLSDLSYALVDPRIKLASTEEQNREGQR